MTTSTPALLRAFKAFCRLWAVLIVATVVGCGERPAATPAGRGSPGGPGSGLKLAAIMPGVATDADFNALGRLALDAIQRDLKVTTLCSESVAVPDFERVAREYLDQGVSVLWAHGGQYVSQTVELAREFPEVSFIVEMDGPLDGAPANLWVLDRSYQLGCYALGVLAALASRTGKVAYVGGLTLPFAYGEIHALRQGIADSGSKVQVKPVFVGDFNDPARARQLASALLAEDVDLVVCSLNLGTFGLFQAIKSSGRPVLVTVKHTDKASFAPKNYVTSLLYDLSVPIKEVVTRVSRGERGGLCTIAFSRGLSVQFPLRNVPAEIDRRVRETVAAIESGKIRVQKDFAPVR